MTTVNKLCFVQNKKFDEKQETIVLVHGMDSCKETFTSVIESEKLLKFNIFAVDLHGHGETPIQNDIFTTIQMVQDLHEFVKENSIPPFYLVGHSMGARVSISYVATHPETVKGLIIEDMDIKKFQGKSKDVDELKTFQDVVDTESFLFCQYKEFGYNEGRVKGWLEDKRIKQKNGKYYCGIRPYVSYMSSLNLLGSDDCHKDFEKLSKIQIPIMLMEAEIYSAISPSSKFEMLELIPSIQHVLVKDSNHSIHKDKTQDQFVELILKFVK
jgi:pimeloyl-ACP methyl ester carboxylesterase